MNAVPACSRRPHRIRTAESPHPERHERTDATRPQSAEGARRDARARQPPAEPRQRRIWSTRTIVAAAVVAVVLSAGAGAAVATWSQDDGSGRRPRWRYAGWVQRAARSTRRHATWSATRPAVPARPATAEPRRHGRTRSRRETDPTPSRASPRPKVCGIGNGETTCGMSGDVVPGRVPESVDDDGLASSRSSSPTACSPGRTSSASPGSSACRCSCGWCSGPEEDGWALVRADGVGLHRLARRQARPHAQPDVEARPDPRPGRRPAATSSPS